MLSRLKTLKRSTKLTLAATTAIVLIAAGTSVWLTVASHWPGPESDASKGSGNQASDGTEATYQHVADLCGEIDWSMLEHGSGSVGPTQETDRPSSSGTGGDSVCSYPFGDDLEGFTAGAYMEVFVKGTKNLAIDEAESSSQMLELTEDGDTFFPDWSYAKIGGYTDKKPIPSGSDQWLESLDLVIQKGNIVVQLTVDLWSESKPDTATPLDEDALPMQMAVSLTSQVEELTRQ